MSSVPSDLTLDASMLATCAVFVFVAAVVLGLF
jgi:hypothetical protein